MRREGVSVTLRIALFSLFASVTTTIYAGDGVRTDWLARYRVLFGATEAGVPTAAVEARLIWTAEAKGCPESVDVDMFTEDQFPQGYGSFVHDFAAILPEGSPAPEYPYAVSSLSVPEGRYRLPVLAGGYVGFRYTVVLEHDSSGWGPGPDEAPYRFEGGVFWTGRALFITAPHSQVEVSFSAPKRDRVSVSFEPIPGRKGTYTVPGESRLRDSMVIVGDYYHEARLEMSKAVVTIALGGKLKDSMPVVEEAVRRFLGASRRVFGGAPPGRILVVGNLGDPRRLFDGGGFGGDLSLLTAEPWETSNFDQWRSFLCHEIFHLWNGTIVSFGDEQQYWFSEGATEYYAHLLLVRLGDLSAKRFLKTLSDKWSSYLRAGSVGLLAAGDNKFLNSDSVYQGGTIAALILDLQIRAATSNRRSLDDVMRALYKQAQGQQGKGLTFDQLVRMTSTVAGAPMDDFFDRYVRGREVLPLADALTLAGISLHEDSTEIPDRGFVLAQLLRCPSVSSGPDGLHIHKSEVEPIRAGDVIVGVDGSPIFGFDDLRWAFRDRQPGSRVSIAVMRDGRKVDLDVVLDGERGGSVPRSRSERVALEPMLEADPMALQIRKSLFGSTLKGERP